MALPPIYKYLDVQCARLTVSNGTFKHAKPSDFNEIEDLKIQSIFPEEAETTLKKLSDGFTGVILRHLNDRPTCGSPMREKLVLIQQVYRSNPKAAQLVPTPALSREIETARVWGWTGHPRSAVGKVSVSRNADKGGARQSIRQLRRLLEEQRLGLHSIRGK